MLGTVFWGTWFDFGTMLTGQPNSHWSSLAAGTVLHIFQGYVLALGYYVLFRRVSLVSALTCLFLILAGLYSWLFPRYVILGPTPFKWFFVIWWAHLWFAIVAWAVPRADTRALQDFLHPPAHARTAVSVALVLAAAPFGFVFWRAGTWQFPRQDVIDRNAFAKLALAPENSSVMSARGVPGEVSYLVTFRLGPRDYSDFEGTGQDLALSAVRITGDVTTVGRPIAFCSASIPALPSGAAIATPASFSAIVRRSDRAPASEPPAQAGSVAVLPPASPPSVPARQVLCRCLLRVLKTALDLVQPELRLGYQRFAGA